MEKNASKNFDFVSFITECFMFILACILKPITSIKNKVNEYADIKTAGILVILVSLCRMIIGLFNAMITTIFVKQRISFLSSDTELKVSFEGLKNLDYFNLIVKQFIGFIVVVAVIAGIYYVVSCVFKKTVNYFKLVSITTVSFIPLFVAGLLSTIIGYVYIPLAAFVLFGAFVYSIVTFIKGMNDEIKLNDNMVVYFQTICLTVMFIIAYYALNDYISSVLSLGSLLK